MTSMWTAVSDLDYRNDFDPEYCDHYDARIDADPWEEDADWGDVPAPLPSMEDEKRALSLQGELDRLAALSAPLPEDEVPHKPIVRQQGTFEFTYLEIA